MFKRLATSLALAVAALNAADSPEVIRAALASHDRAIHLTDAWVRDPYIVLGPDGNYYFTGTTPNEGDNAYLKDLYNIGIDKPAGVPALKHNVVGRQVRVWRSADLASWEPLGVILTHKDSSWYESARAQFDQVPEDKWRVWAPELHFVNGRWVVIHTTPTPLAPKVGATFALSSGPELKGPWASPMGNKIGRRHDPSLFRDDDNTWYLVWGATEIAPLKKDLSDLAAAPIKIGPSGENAKMGHEGCFMRKIGGKYVLLGTGWSTGKMRKGSYNLYYAVADSISGPYTERQFAGRFLGHGTLFQDKQGRWWCTAFYNANVPPVSSENIQTRDLSETAQTINPQGLTLVPMDVSVSADGKVTIRAKDPRYATPGPDEAQKF